MDKSELEGMVKALEDKGYTVTLKPTEPDTDALIKTLTENGYIVGEPTPEPPKPEPTPEPPAPAPKPEPPRSNIYLMGSPTQPSANPELTEERILAMTPEQVKKSLPEIREHILSNGGMF